MPVRVFISVALEMFLHLTATCQDAVVEMLPCRSSPGEVKAGWYCRSVSGQGEMSTCRATPGAVQLDCHSGSLRAG